MSKKSVVEKVISLRQKYKKEYDSTSGVSTASIRKQLLARIVNDLTDLLSSEGQEEKIS